MPIATLSIDIEARLARLEEGLDKAARINAKAAQDVEQRWSSTGAAVKSALAPLAAAFSVEALRQFVLGNAHAVESLNDIAASTGSTVQAISALQDVAQRTGKPIEAVDQALIKFNLALNNAKPDSDAERAFTAIGLSAAELKKQDPAEALRRAAVALSGFADDGNKARLVQVLFGKSLREVAPLLKDLARQTELVGSVTQEQAERAEAFVKALGQFENASTRMRQAFVGSLLPTLTEVIKSFTSTESGARDMSSAVQAALVPIEALAILGANIAFVFKGAGRELGAWEAQLQALARLDISAFRAIGAAVTEDGERARAELDALEQRILHAKDALKRLETPQEAFRRTELTTLPSVGDIAGGMKEKTGDAQKYIEKLQEAQLAVLELSAVERADFDIASGKIKDITKDTRAQILELARGLDLLKEKTKTLESPQSAFRTSELGNNEAFNKTFSDEKLQQFIRSQQELQSLLGETQQVKLNELSRQYSLLADAYARGAVTGQQYIDVLDVLDDRFSKITEPVKQAGEKMSEFAKQAQRNIQSALGDTIEQTLAGKFDGIADLWRNLLRRMVTEALAARIAESLFGKDFTGGLLGGLLSKLPAFAGGTDFVPRTGLAMVHQGERIVPASQNRGGSSAASVTIVDRRTVNVGDIATQSQVAKALAASDARQRFELQRMVSRGEGAFR